MVTVAEVNLKSPRLNCVMEPTHKTDFQKLEKALNDLFLKELNSSGSIFIHLSPNVVKKTAMFLSGVIFRPVAIAICGETASGKSTIVLDTIEVVESFAKRFLSKDLITRINTDDYYYDRSIEVEKAGSMAEFVKTYDLDSPSAIELSLMKKHIQMLLENKEVQLPKYDMSGTAKRFENYRKAKPSSMIISEGLYTLVEEISDVFDFKIYVDIDKEIQKRRFYERAEQRGLGASADRIFENATKKASIYIQPCARSADIIFNGASSRERYKTFMLSLLNLIESNCYNFTL